MSACVRHKLRTGMETSGPSSYPKLRVRDGSERQVRFKSIWCVGCCGRGKYRILQEASRGEFNLGWGVEEKTPKEETPELCNRGFQRSKTVHVKAGRTERSQTCHLAAFECIWSYSKAKIVLSLMTRAMSYISVYPQNLLCSLSIVSARPMVISGNGFKASEL